LKGHPKGDVMFEEAEGKICCQTDLGEIIWSFKHAVVKERLISQLTNLLSSEEEAQRLYGWHFRNLLFDNIVDAVTQAALELVAIAKARPFDKHGRNKVARETADQAYEQSLRRLKETDVFPTVKQRERPDDPEKLYNRMVLGRERIKNAVRRCLTERPKRKPVMWEVARALGMKNKWKDTDQAKYKQSLRKALSNDLKNRLGATKPHQYMVELISEVKNENGTFSN
jgi:hypothetical protein